MARERERERQKKMRWCLARGLSVPWFWASFWTSGPETLKNHACLTLRIRLFERDVSKKEYACVCDAWWRVINNLTYAIFANVWTDSTCNLNILREIFRVTVFVFMVDSPSWKHVIHSLRFTHVAALHLFRRYCTDWYAPVWCSGALKVHSGDCVNAIASWNSSKCEGIPFATPDEFPCNITVEKHSRFIFKNVNGRRKLATSSRGLLFRISSRGVAHKISIMQNTGGYSRGDGDCPLSRPLVLSAFLPERYPGARKLIRTCEIREPSEQ